MSQEIQAELGVLLEVAVEIVRAKQEHAAGFHARHRNRIRAAVQKRQKPEPVAGLEPEDGELLPASELFEGAQPPSTDNGKSTAALPLEEQQRISGQLSLREKWNQHSPSRIAGKRGAGE